MPGAIALFRPDRRIGDLAGAHALFAPLALGPRECAAFAYLDRKWRLLGMRCTAGAVDAIEVALRDVVADTLAFGATAVVMAHNHPSGSALPSDADVALTRRLARALQALDVRLADHLVLAGDGHTSFRRLGLL